MNWKRILQPLASRKVRTAIATVIAAWLAQVGLGLSEELIYTILGVGSAVILGTAHEDAAIKPEVVRTQMSREELLARLKVLREGGRH